MDASRKIVSAVVDVRAGVPGWPLNLVFTLASALALRHVLDLAPLWWLAWLAPLPLLVAIARARRGEAVLLATLAGLIGASANLDYLQLVMGLPGALGVVMLQALAWTLVLGLTWRVLVRGSVLPAVLAYPLLWTAFDTLSTHVLPDGNWGSLGYSQAGFLLAVQIVALGGVPLLVFVMSLPASALALLAVRGKPAWKGVVIGLAVGAASLAWGAQRLSAPMVPGTPVGLASIDDAIGAACGAGVHGAHLAAL
jgi:apolipoprotein N-acyltransferase